MKNGAHILKRARQWWFLLWRAMGLLALAFIFTPIGELPAQVGGFNVDSLLTFTPLSSTFQTLSDTTGCPSTFVGKFTFTARLTNKADSPAMPGLDVFVQTLTNGNVLLDPQTNVRLGGVGAIIPIPQVGEYADGLLSANEAVDVPFIVCLKTLQSFQFFVDVFGVVTELVSINRVGTDSGNGESFVPTLSADGRFVAFVSTATDLVATHTSGAGDVFVRDLQTGTTTLVSVNSAGTASGNGASESPAISANGRFVAFVSRASDLVANDTNDNYDVFVRDLQTGTTTLVSVNQAGTASGNRASGATDSTSPFGPVVHQPVITADGRFVAFVSMASDLVASDTNSSTDVFVRDLTTETTTLVSVNSAGTDSGKGSSSNAVMSADGRFVVFVSMASDLVASDTNSSTDVFVRDLTTETTTLVSVNSAGTDSGKGRFSDGSFNPTLSSNGRFVAFESSASDLVATDTNETRDVFVRDLTTETTTLVSVNSGGTDSGKGGAGGSFGAVMSADGGFVAFVSTASDLVASDTNETIDVFVRDLQTGITTLVSVNSAGTDSGNSSSFDAVMSADGRFVAFASLARDLVATHLNGERDVFVRDLQTGTTTRVSVNSGGTGSGNNDSGSPMISVDGRFVVFTSTASDLVANDTNGHLDVFVRPVP